MIIIVWWWKCLFFELTLNCNFVAANVFGKPKTNTDFLPYNGDGFKLSIPSKWNPSKEREFPGQVLRYEDNFDSNSNVSVIITPTDKKSITDYGSPEEFLSKVYCGSFIAVTIIIHLWINFRLYASCCILSILLLIVHWEICFTWSLQVDYLLGKQAYSGKTSSEVIC